MRRGAGGRVRLGIIGLGAVAQAVLCRSSPGTGTGSRSPPTATCRPTCRRWSPSASVWALPSAAGRPRSCGRRACGRGAGAQLRVHGEVAGAAIARGLAVLCEKPLAYTLAEADELARLSERTGAPLQLGYMKLYDPAVRRAARELAAASSSLRSVEVTVLHPSGSSQLAHAARPPRPATSRRGSCPRSGTRPPGSEPRRSARGVWTAAGTTSRATRPRAVRPRSRTSSGSSTPRCCSAVWCTTWRSCGCWLGSGAGGVRGRVAGRDLGVGGGRGRLSGRGSVQPALALSGPVSRVPGGGAGAPRRGTVGLTFPSRTSSTRPPSSP